MKIDKAMNRLAMTIALNLIALIFHFGVGSGSALAQQPDCQMGRNDCELGFSCVASPGIRPPFGVCTADVVTPECQMGRNDCEPGFSCVAAPGIRPPFGVCRRNNVSSHHHCCHCYYSCWNGNQY
jgi:hypothetical protein